MGGSGETHPDLIQRDERSTAPRGSFPGSNNDDYAMALGVDSKGELILAGYTGAKANSLGEKKTPNLSCVLGEKGSWGNGYYRSYMPQNHENHYEL